MQLFAGKNVTVIGLGIEGQDLVRFFAEEGAHVTVSDAKSPERLEAQLAAIAGLDVTLSLGANRRESVEGADLVAVTQGAPLSLPPVERARELGIRITSLTELFLQLCPGIVVGISGSSGKTTTTSLVGAILTASGRPTVVGGNIGRPLLSLLGSIAPETWIVLEVSHTQLLLTDRSPHVACLTNVTPNHLDQFSWEAYVDLKRNLIRHQTPADLTILNLDNAITREMAGDTAGCALYFSLSPNIPGDGAFVRQDQIFQRWIGREAAVLPVADIPLRGRHNVENVVCATAVAAACGVDPETTAASIRSFQPVPHRLERVAEIDGASYYNDSIATTPERTLAGLHSFDETIVLLLGGRDKHLPLEDLATEANRRCRGVICFGEAGDLLASAIKAAHPHRICEPTIRRVATLEDAVQAAANMAQAGDVVLLSPACNSFDAYDNFERRGEAFRALVRAHADQAGGPIADSRLRSKEAQSSNEA